MNSRMTPWSSQARHRATPATVTDSAASRTGLIATLAAMVATTLADTLAQAVGVDFEIPDGGEKIPLSGFAVVPGFFSVLGIVLAASLLVWSARPATLFVRAAVSLTAISLVPPPLCGAHPATITALIGLHLVAATMMIPTLARSLRTRTVGTTVSTKGHRTQAAGGPSC